MNFNEVRAYFGSDNKACQALGIARENFVNWRRRGRIPFMQQYKFEQLTNGQLKAEIYEPRRDKKK